MIEPLYTLTVYRVGGQTLTFSCRAYSFAQTVDKHGHLKQDFSYEPLEDDPMRVAFLNSGTVAALTVVRSAEVIAAEGADRAAAAEDDG